MRRYAQSLGALYSGMPLPTRHEHGRPPTPSSSIPSNTSRSLTAGTGSTATPSAPSSAAPTSSGGTSSSQVSADAAGGGVGDGVAVGVVLAGGATQPVRASSSREAVATTAVFGRTART